MTAEVLTVREAAAILKVGPKTIRRLCRLKRLPHRVVDLRNTIRISRAALDAFVAGGGK
jgi:excisionase family DNA binding protein